VDSELLFIHEDLYFKVLSYTDFFLMLFQISPSSFFYSSPDRVEREVRRSPTRRMASWKKSLDLLFPRAFKLLMPEKPPLF
jgi:hypothetical protein